MRRQVDLGQAGPRPRGQQDQVAGDLRQLDGRALERRGIDHEPLLFPGGRQHVLGRHDRLAGELGQVRRGLLGVTLRRVEAGADRRRPHVDDIQVLFRLTQVGDLGLQRRREGVELLADGHRHRVLELGAPHLHDVDEGFALPAERLGQVVQLRGQPVVAQQQGHLDRRRVGVVGRLRHVEVIVRLDDLVVALLVPGQLERDVGHHLVGVHVGRGAGAALVPVDLELVVILPLHEGFGRLLDRPEHLLVHRADIGVAAGRRQLHDRPRLDEPRIVVDGHRRRSGSSRAPAPSGRRSRRRRAPPSRRGDPVPSGSARWGRPAWPSRPAARPWRLRGWRTGGSLRRARPGDGEARESRRAAPCRRPTVTAARLITHSRSASAGWAWLAEFAGPRRVRSPLSKAHAGVSSSTELRLVSLLLQ